MTAASSPVPADATLSVTRAAQLLGVHPNTVRAWSEEGRLRHYRINARGDRRYRMGDLRQFLAAAERGHAAAPADAASPAPTRAAGPAAATVGPAGAATPGRRTADGVRPGARPADTLAGDPVRPDIAAALPLPRLADLARLADLTAGGRTLDAMLGAAARLVRDATGAADVCIAQRIETRLTRRAVAGQDGPVDLATEAALLRGVAANAISQRRPSVEEAPGRDATHVAVPIPGPEPWGAIAARLPHRDAPLAVDWLEAAAALLAGAIRSDDLLADAARDIHRGEALRRIALDTTGSLDVAETLARIVDHGLVLFEADRAAAMVVGRGPEVIAEASRGLSAGYLASVRQLRAGSPAALAIDARRPIAVGATDAGHGSSEARAILVQEGVATTCAAPLLDGEHVLGLIAVHHDRPRPWDTGLLDTMAEFASQATVAVRAAQQYSQLARWAVQLQSIQQLGVRLNRLTTVPEIASAIARELRTLIDTDNIRVYRLHDNDLLAVALHATDEAYYDETPSEVSTRLGEGITGWVAAHGVAQNLPDSSADPRTEDIPGSDHFDESMLVAPMIFEDRVLGVIALASRGLHRFDDDDLRLLEIYGTFAAQAMAHAETTERLRDQSAALQRQLRGQRELLDITESILSTLDPPAVMEQVADRLGRLVRYDVLTIDVTDRRTGALVPLTARTGDGEARPHPGTDDALTRWVMRHNEGRMTGADGADPADPANATVPAAPATPPDPAAPGLRPARPESRIVVPLRAHDGVRGVLALSRSSELPAFTGDEFELVQLFAAQVSIALENAETHRAVEVRAQTDDLTGLLNHGTLREWLERATAPNEVYSLVMLDLDQFKAVNDAFGHQAGDRLLSEIGTAIVAAGRETDLVFRYGGDEFAVLLPGTGAAQAMTVARRIQASVRAVGRSRAGGRGRTPHAARISASIGVATYPADGATGSDILLAADRACFVAKRNGRDRIADAASGLALAAEFSLQRPTPVDSSTPRWAGGTAPS